MRVIHILDSLDAVNMGVWKAAIATASQLSSMGIVSEMWFPEKRVDPVPPAVIPVPLKKFSIAALQKIIAARSLNKYTDLIVSHGCWRYATKWGAHLHQNGFIWIYTPQGMLEPWPMRHKYLKKKIYFSLVEKRMAVQADVIRAVSNPEKKTLEKLFPGSAVKLIPNGVVCSPLFESNKPDNRINFVFMARLHHKKGLIPLVQAWLRSTLLNNPAFQLQIAGPDEGELPLLTTLISGTSNIEYRGVVSGEEKDKLLSGATYYVLPSFSEGFPTSLLEAMERGAIPVITRGCNFDEVFEQELGYEITTDPANIQQVLEQLAKKGNYAGLKEKAEKTHNFIRDNYTLDRIASMQYDLYVPLLNSVS